MKNFFTDLKPIQALVANLFFKKKNLLLMLPRQEGKTELGIRLIHDLINSDKTRAALFLSKSKSAGIKATREKFSRIFPENEFKVNTAQVYKKTNPSAICYMDSVDKQPSRLRGGTYKLVHWSEVAFSEFDHGVTIEHVLNTCIRPTMRATNGLSYLESTANGKNGWFDLWENAEKLGFHKLKVPLSLLVDLGFCDVQEYEKLQKTMPRLEFLQEYECEFVIFQGITYDELKSHHIWEMMPNPSSKDIIYAGIDWGWDPSATSVVFCYVLNGRVCVFDEIYSKKITNQQLAKLIQDKIHFYDLRKFNAYGDHDPKSIDELSRYGIPVSSADKSNVLGQRMDIKTLFCQNKLYIHPRCKNLLKDLQSATWDTKKHGDIEYAKCSWGHFDAEAALRYVIRSVIFDKKNDEKLEMPHWAKR